MASSAPTEPAPDIPHQTNWKGALIGVIFALIVLGVAGASMAIAYNTEPGGYGGEEKTEEADHSEDKDEGDHSEDGDHSDG